MSHTILPYTRIIIPKEGARPEKELFCPILETYLFNKDQETKFSFRSIVDSGADFCVFPARFGELIGLDIKEGQSIESFGVGGKETLYFHDVKVGVMIQGQLWKFKCLAAFSIKMNSKGTGLLGRKGFFDLFSEVSFNQQKKLFRLKE